MTPEERYRETEPIWAEMKRLLGVIDDKAVLPALERLIEEHRRLITPPKVVSDTQYERGWEPYIRADRP